MRRVLLICAALFCIASSLVAQEDPQPFNCETEAITATLTAAQESITKALELHEDDPAAALAMMAEVSTAFDLLYASCHGLVFEGANPSLLGPIVFPDGGYRVTATTEGYLIAEITTIAGVCDTSSYALFNLSRGQATDGAETLLTTEGCMALVEVSNTSEPWTLAFDNILPQSQ